MGWWKETVDGDEVELGDEPCDLIIHALAEVTRSYEEDLERKPTLEEFRAMLTQALAGDPSQYFSDMDEHVVASIAFRCKKVPKRQVFAVGNYFAIPLDGKYWYGRIIHGTGTALVEIYALETDRLLTLQELLARKSKVALQKHVFGGLCFTRRRWRIIGHAKIPKDFQYPPIRFGMMAFGNYMIRRGDVETIEPKKAAMKCESCQVWWPERFEKALRDKDFGEWPEVTAEKKDTFDNHDERMKFLHEHFKIPLKPKRK